MGGKEDEQIVLGMAWFSRRRRDEFWNIPSGEIRKHAYLGRAMYMCRRSLQQNQSTNERTTPYI